MSRRGGALRHAVEAAVNAQPIPVVHGDGQGDDMPVPVFFCAEIVDQPAVAAIIDETIAKMKPAYDAQ